MKHYNLATMISILFALLTVVQSAAAQEHIVTQKDLKFHPVINVVKPGDTVRFENKDNVVHNIVSLTEDFEFDLGEFKPGMSKSVEFKHKGVVDVQCTIHPDMKMTIFVF